MNVFDRYKLLAESRRDEWHKDSHPLTKNKDGTPKTLYHGTARDFNEFSGGHLGSSVDNPTTRMGHFFTEQPEGASRWANKATQRTSGSIIYPVHLNIKKPRVIDSEKFKYFLKSARASTIDKFVEDSKKKGHDGLKIDYHNQHHQGSTPVEAQETWWVAFHPHQIKSVFSKTFDPKKNNISEEYMNILEKYMLIRERKSQS